MSIVTAVNNHKQRIVIGGILGVAVLGLVLDKTMLAPSDASASLETSDLNLEVEESLPGSILDELNARSESELRESLERARASLELDLINVPDAFSEPAGWESALPASGSSETLIDGATDEPQPEFQLSSVFTTRDGAQAVINGEVVRLGESVGDWTFIRSIKQPGLGVVLEKDGREITIEVLPMDRVTSRSKPGATDSSASADDESGNADGSRGQ